MNQQIKLPLRHQDIQKIIPHRYPFLLVDEITDLSEGYIKGFKNVSINEPFFQGHFPGLAIMPGVLIIEALAQIVCISEMLKEENKNKIGVFAGFDKVRFKKLVLPGDQLILEAKVLWIRKGLGQCSAQAFVKDELCCSGNLTFAISIPDDLL